MSFRSLPPFVAIAATAAVTFLTALTASCGGGETAIVTPPVGGDTAVDVYTVNAEFSDAVNTIARGDTVRWHFARATDGLGHNVRFTPRIDGAPADIGTQAAPLASGVVSRVFNTTGDFHYVCDLHGSMVGEIIVQ